MNPAETKEKDEKITAIKISQKDFPVILKKSFQTVTSKFSSITQRIPAVQIYTKVAFFVSSMSIRYKIAGALIFVLLLTIASLGVVTFSRQKYVLEEEMKKRATVLVQHLSNIGKEGLLTKDELHIFSTIKDIQKNSGVVYAMVLDSKGTVFAHNQLTEKGEILTAETDQKAVNADDLLFQNNEFAGEPVLDASLPILYKIKNIKLGTARIGISKKELQNAIARQKILFFWISALFVAIGLLIAFALAKILTGPIYTLAVGMQIVAQGDLSQQVKVYYKDEIGKLTESFNQMILSLREKLHMEKYLSYSTLKSIKKSRDETQLKLGGERKYVTALFSDVRGFTSMSEKMTPEEVVEVLNIYLNLQAKIIHHRGGIVDKYVGDEVMAIFEGRGQETNAVRAAIEIQHFCKALNWSREKLEKKQMFVGIGLHSGEVVMGNMGSEQQMNYTVIGDNINLAARLCSAASAGQVVISKVCADAIGKEAKLKKLDPVTVKGKEKPIEIFEVTDISKVSRKYMRRALEMGISYHLSGLADESNAAIAKNVGSGGCLLEVPVPIGVGSKLNLHFNHNSLKVLKEVKAVVRHAKKHESQYYIGVYFEGLSDSAKAEITDWVHQVESEIVQSNS